MRHISEGSATPVGWLGVVCVILLTHVAILALGGSSAPQPQAPFRTGVTLVPVDVRVIDGSGDPMTDLTAGDFELFEDGKRQRISEFATQSYLSSISDAAPRTFAIVLGRGSLNAPGKGIDGMIEFVRSHLLPRDRVCVFAYLRMTELTTDHESIVRLLERFRALHPGIEDRIKRDWARPGPAPGGKAAPDLPLLPDTQAAIAQVFQSAGLPRVQLFPGGEGGRGFAFLDSTYLNQAMQYLRRIDGEKQLVFLLERPLPGVGVWAQRAASARVAVSWIQTGGIDAPRELGGPVRSGVASVSRIPFEVQAVATDRYVADESGGIAAFYDYADRSIVKLARATSFHYLLGFYPSMPPSDGEFRDIKVSVKRRNATVLFRHGYESRPPEDGGPLDVRAIMTEARIMDTLALSRTYLDSTGTKLNWWDQAKARATSTADVAGGLRVDVELELDPRHVTAARIGNDYFIDLDVAAFARDDRQRILGEKRSRIELRLTTDEFARVLKGQLRHSTTLVLSRKPADVKVVVVEYGSNRATYAEAKVR